MIWHKRKYNNKVEVEKLDISLVVLYLRFIFYFQEKIKMAKVAIIYYSQTGTTHKLAQGVEEGARGWR